MTEYKIALIEKIRRIVDDTSEPISPGCTTLMLLTLRSKAERAMKPIRSGEVAVVLFVLFVLVAVFRIGEVAWIPMSQGSLMLLLLGLALLSLAVETIQIPRADGLRAVKLIKSGDIGPTEAFGARLAAATVAVLGAGMVAVAFWTTVARPIVGLLFVAVAADILYDPRSLGPRSMSLIDLGQLGPAERVVVRLAAAVVLLIGIGLTWSAF